MASFQGTNTGYESVSPYRIYENLFQPDREFPTNLVSPVADTDNNGSDYVPPAPSTYHLPTTLDVVQKHPKLVEFSKWLDFYHITHLLDQKDPYTLFAPLNVSYLNAYLPWMRPEDMLLYHMTDYIITPVQLFNSTYRIDMKLRSHFILTKNMKVVGLDTTSPYRDDFIPIVETMQTDNGFLYFIEIPLLPYNLNR